MDEGPERSRDAMENSLCVCVGVCVGLFHKIPLELCVVEADREDMQI